MKRSRRSNGDSDSDAEGGDSQGYALPVPQTQESHQR